MLRERREEVGNVAHKTKEGANVAGRARDRPGKNAVDFRAVGADAVAGDGVSKKVQLDAEQLSLFEGTVETVSTQSGQDEFHVTAVFFDSLRPDDDVIKVDMADFTDVRPEGMEHPALVGAGGVMTALRHYRPFVKAEQRGDGHVFDVFGTDTCLKKGVGHIEFTPDASLGTVGEDLGNGGKRVRIGYGVVVQLAVVVDPARGSCRVRFGNEESRGSIQGVRGAQAPRGEVLIEELLPDLTVLPWTVIRAPPDDLVRVTEVELMIDIRRKLVEVHTVPFWLTGLAVQPELTIPQAKCSPDIGRIYVIANDTDSAKRFPHACTQCPGRASTCLGEASRPRSLQQRYGRGACIPEYSCPGRFSTCLAASFRPGVHIPI